MGKQDIVFFRHRFHSGLEVLQPTPNLTDEQQQANISIYNSPYGVSKMLYMSESSGSVFVSVTTETIIIGDMEIITQAHIEGGLK